MNGRTALVTGGSRGIGRAIVDRFTALGARVLAPSRAELDLASPDSVEAYAVSLGPVDILVNNAGINPLGSAVEMTDEDLAETMQVNLLAPMRLVRRVAAGMTQRGYGRIVNISSIWGTVSKPRRFVYSTTKSAMDGMTRALAVEVAGSGVLVNAVAPGFVDTELTRQNNSPEQIAAIVTAIPVGRLASPAEVAEVVAFLASERNAFVTGQTLLVDGGYSCL